MNLRDILKKYPDGMTFRSEDSDTNIGVTPEYVIVQTISLHTTLFQGPNKGEQQIYRLLEEYNMKRDNFSEPH